MNNACPRCGALYNISAKDVGRRIACKKCKAPLTVDDDGIRVDEPAVSASNLDEAKEVDLDDSEELPAPPRRQPRKTFGPKLTLPEWATFSLVPTLLFGFGMFLVVVFSFFPAIDQAAVTGIQGEIDEGQAEDDKDEILTNRLNKGNPSAEELENRSKRRSNWNDERKVLENDKLIAQADANSALVWNKRGLLFGFVVLCFAGIGYLVTDQPPSRKILGGVLLVLIFLAVTKGSLTIGLGPVGG